MILNHSISNNDVLINESNHEIVSIIPLFIIFFGFTGNSISLIVFCFDKGMSKISFSAYLIYLAITDTLALFVWNLNNFLSPNFNIKLENFGNLPCKFFSFLQHFSFYSSSYLLCFVTIDRYITVISTPGSFASKLPFRTVKSARYWSLLIFLVMLLINSHFLVFNRIKIFETNQTSVSNISILKFSCYYYPNEFYIIPLIEKINVIIYSVIPTFIMVIFNGLLLIKTYSLNKKNQLKIGSTKKHHITVTLLVLSITFIIMTAPSQIVYGFLDRAFKLKQPGKIITQLIGDLRFLSNTTLFYTCFLTNYKFREAFYKKFNFLSRFKKYQVKK